MRCDINITQQRSLLLYPTINKEQPNRMLSAPNRLANIDHINPLTTLTDKVSKIMQDGE